MAKKQKIAEVIGLQVWTERDRTWSDFFHVKAQPVLVGPSANEVAAFDRGETQTLPSRDRVQGFASSDSRNGLLLDNLQVTSQGNGTDTPRHLYAWEVSYRNVYIVNSERAKGMHETLTRIERHITTLYTKYGNPATFGQYVARVAEAIGATRIVITRENPKYEKFHICDIADGIYSIDAIVQRWVKREEEAVEA